MTTAQMIIFHPTETQKKIKIKKYCFKTSIRVNFAIYKEQERVSRSERQRGERSAPKRVRQDPRVLQNFCARLAIQHICIYIHTHNIYTTCIIYSAIICPKTQVYFLLSHSGAATLSSRRVAYNIIYIYAVRENTLLVLSGMRGGGGVVFPEGVSKKKK